MKRKVLHILNSDEGGIGAFVLNKAIAFEHGPLVFDCLMTKQPSEEFSLAISRMGGKIFIMKNPKKESVRDFFIEAKNFVHSNGPYEMTNMHFTGYRALPFKLLAMLERNKRFVLHAHTAKPLSNNWQNSVRKFINRVITDQFISCEEKASLALYGEKV